MSLSVRAQSNSFVCTGVNEAYNYNASISYLGCHTDADTRYLDGPQISIPQNDPQVCANKCGYQGYHYSAVEYTTQCFCGNVLSPDSTKLSESSCNYTCPGDSSEICGGTYVYVTNLSLCVSRSTNTYEYEPLLYQQSQSASASEGGQTVSSVSDRPFLCQQSLRYVPLAG